MTITTPKFGTDFELFKSVVNQGIDSHLEAFTQSKFYIEKERFIFQFAKSEIPILLRRLREQESDHAQQWADDIEEHNREVKDGNCTQCKEYHSTLTKHDDTWLCVTCEER